MGLKSNTDQDCQATENSKLGKSRGRKGKDLKSFKMGMIRIAYLPER